MSHRIVFNPKGCDRMDSLHMTHEGFLKARYFIAAKAAEKALFKPEKGYYRVERHANKDRVYVYDRKGTRRIVQ